MKFEEALNIAEGNLITEENKNEEVLLEIMPLNYYNKIMADPNITSIKKYNARVIAAESKAYKGRAIKNGIEKVSVTYKTLNNKSYTNISKLITNSSSDLILLVIKETGPHRQYYIIK